MERLCSSPESRYPFGIRGFVAGNIDVMRGQFSCLRDLISGFVLSFDVALGTLCVHALPGGFPPEMV